MSIELRLPQLAETVTSAKLGTWLKQEGDTVEAGEPIVEVETDKTNVELEAPASGVVHKIHVKAGTGRPGDGALLAVISEGAEPAGADDGQTRATEDAAPPPEAPPTAAPTPPRPVDASAPASPLARRNGHRGRSGPRRDPRDRPRWSYR